MQPKPDNGSRERRRGAIAAGRELGAGKQRKCGRGSRDRPRKDPGLETMGLVGHLCEIIGLFPNASEEAVREFAGRMMTGRLQCEMDEKRRRAADPNTRRAKDHRRR